MMQSWCHSRDVKNHQRCAWLSIYTYQTLDSGTTYHDDGKSGVQHAICKMRLRGIVAPYLEEIGIMRAPPGNRSLFPKHAVREGLLALAEDKRPEANTAHNFWVCMDRNPKKGVIIYVGRVSVGHRHKSLTHRRIAKLVRWGINIHAILIWCDKALISRNDISVPTTERTISKMSKLKYELTHDAFDIMQWERKIMHAHDNQRELVASLGMVSRDKLSSNFCCHSRGSSGQTWASERL